MNVIYVCVMVSCIICIMFLFSLNLLCSCSASLSQQSVECGAAHCQVNISSELHYSLYSTFRRYLNITMNKRDRMIACEMIRQEFVKTGKYQNWRNHSQDFEIRSETALDVKELFDSRLPKVINKVNSHIPF